MDGKPNPNMTQQAIKAKYVLCSTNFGGGGCVGGLGVKKSCRVLRELQMDGKPNPSMTQQAIKAKYVDNSFSGEGEGLQVVSRAKGASDGRKTQS